MTTNDGPIRSDGEIVATAGTYYRVTRYVITAVMIGLGLWFGYDGFFGYPKHNRIAKELEQQKADAQTEEEKTALQTKIVEHGKAHTDTDIFVQKLLFFALPPLGIALIARWIYISRGAYRLTRDNVLHVPGHPPVPLDSITEIDKRQWDRKGIAYISYELKNGQKGTLRLDDFVYQREPTDEIFKRIEEHVAPNIAKDEAPQEQSTSS